MNNVLYLPSGEYRPVAPENGQQFLLAELREIVGGQPYGLVLEESGTAMVGAREVRDPINHSATEIVQHWIGPYTEVFGRAMHCPVDRLPPELFSSITH